MRDRCQGMIKCMVGVNEANELDRSFSCTKFLNVDILSSGSMDRP